MTREEKLVRRVLPLWTVAAALFVLPHACRGFGPGTTSLTTLAAYIALLLPLAWAVCHFTAMRTWRGVVVAGAAFAGAGGAFFLSALPIGFHDAAELPALAGLAWLVVAVRAARDPGWRWADARRAVVPGWPMLGFLVWAALAAGAWYASEAVLSMRRWGFPPRPTPGAVAWGVVLVVSCASLFQIALRASRSFTARSAASLVAAAYALCATRGFGHVAATCFFRGPIVRAIADASLIGFVVFLLQDELARQLPGEGLLARQRAHAGWRVLLAAGVAAASVLALSIWNAYRWDMSVTLAVPATAVAFVVFCHLALAARLPAPLPTKLVVSGLALFAAMDLVLFVAPDVPRYLDTGLDSGFLRSFVALRNGLTAFAVVGWSGLCSITHVEYRGLPLAVKAMPVERGSAPEADCPRR